MIQKHVSTWTIINIITKIKKYFFKNEKNYETKGVTSAREKCRT